MDRATLPLGTWLGELEIVRVLAVGGFGIVYLARDHALDRDVAVKEFMPALLAERSRGLHVTIRSPSDVQAYAVSLRSFIDEAKLLARFSHPAVVKVYHFWEANGTGYMVMQYLHGPTLGDVRRSMSEPPTEAWLRSMVEPLLDALAMLHAEGVCHRDIAPDNVMVCAGGVPVLLDFGAARWLVGDRTQSLAAVLKPCYAPIEQYAEATATQQGPWTDLYALGALVMFLIDGQPPPPATARCLQDDMSALAPRRIRGVSTRFLAAMDWALAVRPEDRPRSVAALRDAMNGRITARTIGSGRWSMTMRSGTRTVSGVLARVPRTIAMRLNGSRSVVIPVDAKVLTGRSLAVRAWLPAMGVALVLAGAAAWSRLASPEVVASVPSGVNVVAPALVPSMADTGEADAPVVRVAESSGVARAAENASDEIAPSKPQRRIRTKGTPNNRHAVTGARAATPGPLELCAGRNFFLRPFCVQRRCDEPRFKGRAECTPPRTMARYDRY